MMRSALLFAGTALLVAGCGTTVEFARTETPPRPLRVVPEHRVEVYMSQLPDRPYRELGLLQARQRSSWSTDRMPQIIQKLRRRAGKLGCDGVIVQGPSHTTRTDLFTYLLTDEGRVYTREGYWGVCVLYEPEGGDPYRASRAHATHDTATASPLAGAPTQPIDPDCEAHLARVREAVPGEDQRELARRTPPHCH